jgi:hypothetical protein
MRPWEDVLPLLKAPKVEPEPTRVLEHRDRPKGYRVPSGPGIETVEILYHLAHALYALSLGNVPPFHRDVSRNLHEPRIGDLVCEVTTYRAPACECVGWLRSYSTGRGGTNATIDRFDGGGEVAWSNCRFVALPLGHIDSSTGDWR